jgi:hypothetical protein
MQWTVVVFLLTCVGFASFAPISPPIPVADTEHGIRRFPAEPQPAVQLEFFVDMTCGDGQNAWPIIRDLQQYYGSTQLDVIFQQIQAPYHRNGFLVSQGLYVIQQHLPDRIWDYVDETLRDVSRFSWGNTVNKTETQVLSDLADVAVASTGIDRDLFISDVPNHRSFAISSYKYSIRRGAAATPTYFVNGVDLVVGTNYVPSFEDWVAFLDPLIHAA